MNYLEKANFFCTNCIITQVHILCLTTSQSNSPAVSLDPRIYISVTIIICSMPEQAVKSTCMIMFILYIMPPPQPKIYCILLQLLQPHCIPSYYVNSPYYIAYLYIKWTAPKLKNMQLLKFVLLDTMKIIVKIYLKMYNHHLWDKVVAWYPWTCLSPFFL